MVYLREDTSDTTERSMYSIGFPIFTGTFVHVRFLGGFIDRGLVLSCSVFVSVVISRQWW